jgi:hypothetical protein
MTATHNTRLERTRPVSNVLLVVAWASRSSAAFGLLVCCKWKDLREELLAKIKVEEQYLGYTPPVRIHRSLRLLLRYVPEEYLRGLYRITLTNSENLRSVRGKITSEKRRFRPAECQGLYRRGHIFLVIDRIFIQYPELFLLVSPFKTYVIGEVLYHEIGHHIHRLEEPGYRTDKEIEADEWRDKLMQWFLRKRYWYLAWTASLARPLIRPLAARLKDRIAKEDD